MFQYSKKCAIKNITCSEGKGIRDYFFLMSVVNLYARTLPLYNDTRNYIIL